jgi:hypothetical protein
MTYFLFLWKIIMKVEQQTKSSFRARIPRAVGERSSLWMIDCPTMRPSSTVERESAVTGSEVRDNSKDLSSGAGFNSLVTSLEPNTVCLVPDIAKLA